MRKYKKLVVRSTIISLAALASVASPSIPANAADTSPRPLDYQASLTVAKSAPAVVSIFQTIGNRTAEVFAGTGFFVDSRGYILTSNHVLFGSGGRVRLADGTSRPATVVFRDGKNDIALLHIEGTGYSTLKLGDSSLLKSGDAVLGMAPSVAPLPAAAGVVTGYDVIGVRDERGKTQAVGVFKSNAPFVPGYSGGPLLDIQGNVVGINDSIAATQHALSYSVPINAAKAALRSIPPSK